MSLLQEACWLAASPIISPYPKSSFYGMLLNKKGVYGIMRVLLYFHIWAADMQSWLGGW